MARDPPGVCRARGGDLGPMSAWRGGRPNRRPKPPAANHDGRPTDFFQPAGRNRVVDSRHRQSFSKVASLGLASYICSGLRGLRSGHKRYSRRTAWTA